jgi:hypothetical protein
MIKSFTGHYDGKVLVIDEPVKLPVGKKLSIQVIIEPRSTNGKGRRKIIGRGEFHPGIPDLGSKGSGKERSPSERSSSKADKNKKTERPRKRKLKFFGVGQFSSGIPDLGSNKKHLEGFGRDSGISR